MTDTDEARAAYTGALRDLADRLDRNPDAPLPSLGSKYFKIPFFAEDGAETRAVRRLVGPMVKAPEGAAHDPSGTLLEGMVGPLHVRLYPPEGVCERVRVGTETVQTEEIVTPAVTRTVTVEQPVYEVRCPDSLLADTERTVTA